MGQLSSRLPKALADQPIWRELMECFDELMEPLYDRIDKAERSGSIFTADDDDLDLMIEESGDVFNVEWNDADSKPLSVLWRKGDIKFKTTAIPMEAMLERAFIGLDAKWSPYYSPISGTYDIDGLRSADQIEAFGLDIADYFITSRGFYRIDVYRMLELGITQTEVWNILRDQIDRIVPVHIVYDGISFLLSATIRDMSINTSAEYKASQASPASIIPINASILPRPTRDSGAVDIMDVFAREKYLLMDDMPVDFWPIDKPLFIDDGLTIQTDPINRVGLSGQLGDGQVIPEVSRQLGDGQENPDTTTQLGNGQEES